MMQKKCRHCGDGWCNPLFERPLPAAASFCTRTNRAKAADVFEQERIGKAKSIDESEAGYITEAAEIAKNNKSLSLTVVSQRAATLFSQGFTKEEVLALYQAD